VEWRGVPGYRTSGYVENFFSPLPRHAWGNILSKDLLTSEISNRMPIGWGPYVIEEWTNGDHITLNRNPNYFRNQEGLPSFDKLVFRFMPDGEEAITALLAGECDYLDETTRIDDQITQLLELQDKNKLKVIINIGTAWEQIVFGIESLHPGLPAFLQTKEMRQAIALCLDRERIVEELFGGKSKVAESYVSADNPLFNKDAKRYNFDPQGGIKLLEAMGWLDGDNDPETPRLSQGVTNIPDNTPLEINFLTTDEEEKQFTAEIIQESLNQCGFEVNVMSIPPSDLLAPGPEGLIFGRNFSMAQFGWVSANEPPCFLYTTQQIPGPYPDYPLGWGGANAGGYSNPEFDFACQKALSTLPGDLEHQTAHFQAQMIFSEELPAIPLYWHPKVVATRPDLCSDISDSPEAIGLWNLETFYFGEGCNK
jgi:peptide/nickel transport system substrate-binding protein